MSFAFSTGDFLAVVQLAWTVYKSCKEAPESFNNISVEVLSLHAVLKETEEIISGQTLPLSAQHSLAIVTHSCDCVLKDVQVLVEKYESLGSQSKQTFDRLKWASKDISELKAKLTSNTALLNTFVNTSQGVVEKKLQKLMQEFQDGKHEDSILTVATVDSLAQNERETWRAIRKEFESIGISATVFDANKAFIMSWFQQAIETGAFEEQGREMGNDVSEDDAISFTTLDSTEDEASLREKSQQLKSTSATSLSCTLDSSIPHISQGSKAETFRPVESRSNLEKSADLQQALGPGPPLDQQPTRSTNAVSKKRSLRLSLVTWLLRYNKAFYHACAAHQFDRASEFLEKGADINTRQKHFTPLTYSAFHGDIRLCMWLLENGADPEARDGHKLTPLHRASSYLSDQGSCQNQLDIVEALINRGAKIDALDREGNTAVNIASRLEHISLLQLFLNHGLNSSVKRLSLITAAEFGHFDVLRVLLSHKVAVEPCELEQLNEALSLVVAGNRNNAIQTVPLLLDHGADINYKFAYDRNLGVTALYCALRCRNDVLAQLLIERGAALTSRSDRPPIFHVAIQYGCLEAIKALLARGFDIETKGPDDLTPLDVAVWFQRIPIAKFLLSQGAINKPRNSRDQYPGYECGFYSIYGDEVFERLNDAYANFAQELKNESSNKDV